MNTGAGFKLSNENTVYDTPHKLLKAFESVLKIPVWCLNKPQHKEHRISVRIEEQEDEFSDLMFETWKSMAETGEGTGNADLDDALSFLASLQ